MQKFQNWLTQQWAILWGKRFEPETAPWLMGPFGKLGPIADNFVNQLAEDEGLIIERNATSQGLIPSISKLKISGIESSLLSKRIIDFYENTAHYDIKMTVQWNPLLKVFGKLVNNLFSYRIQQLHIPTDHMKSSTQINSEIITLTDPKAGEVKYTIWYRTLKSTGQVLYSGVYTTCTLPSGEICIKAVFPLPKGNATVIMSPSIGPGGELRLNSSGNKFGDPGLYFLLNDSKGDLWIQYIRSFRDQLIVYCHEGSILAEQTLTLWHQRVLRYNYEMQPKK